MKTAVTFSLLFLLTLGQSQTFNIVAGNLHSPFGLHFTESNELYLTEAGTGINDGAVSLVNPDGSLTPIITGLASIFDPVEFETIGPWRTAIKPGDDDHLFVVTPLTGGISEFKISGNPTFPLNAADATGQIPIADFVYQNQPDTLPDSDPFSVAYDATGNLYVCDAAFNGIVKVDAATGTRSVFAFFPPTPNPLPFGPPVVDAVPTVIVAKPGGGFFVSQLTGFPFLEGTAKIFELSATGAISTYASGLTLLTDLHLDKASGDLYALQFGKFSTDPMMPGFVPSSSKVTRIKPDGTQQTVAENFGPSPSLAFDKNGALYVTELYSGLLLKMNGVISAAHSPEKEAEMTVLPNPASDFAQVSFFLKTSSPVVLRVRDGIGRPVFEKNLGQLEVGNHETGWQMDGQPAGIYFVEIQAEGKVSVQKLIVK